MKESGVSGEWATNGKEKNRRKLSEMMKNKQNATNKNRTQDRHRGGPRNQLSNNFFVIYFQLNLYIYIFQNFQKLLHLLFFSQKSWGVN